MNSKMIKELIKKQISVCEQSNNIDYSDIQNNLIEPRKEPFILRKISSKDEILELWLVYVDHTGGYKIFYDEVSQEFGLAGTKSDGNDFSVIFGYYGNFVTTLTAM